MNIVLLVSRFLKKAKPTESMAAPDGFCPNCWGHTEYGGNFYEAIKGRKADILKKDPDVGWIQDYVEKNLSNIVLVKKDDALICRKCQTSYKPTELS